MCSCEKRESTAQSSDGGYIPGIFHATIIVFCLLWWTGLYFLYKYIMSTYPPEYQGQVPIFGLLFLIALAMAPLGAWEQACRQRKM